VKKLREVKFREEKPFAVMVKDILQAAELCEINEKEKKLTSLLQNAQLYC